MTRRSSKPYEYEVDADPFVVCGIDAEWTYESAGRNLILSYQFAVINANSGKMSKLIILPKNGARIELEHGLSRALLKARKRKVIDKVPNKFVIAGHFTRADLTTFENFGWFKRRIGAVRKTFATTMMPLRLRLAASEGPVKCSCLIVDTVLLAPAGTSLETIGKLLGMLKIELPPGYTKDRMDLFLRDHPKLFKKYAVTDAVIAAKWVTKTYGLLLERLGIGKKVITLGGAAVELVRRQAKSKGIDLNKFLGQEKPKQSYAHLAPLIAIAAQAYHGGYNIAAALGFSPAGKELKDLDIRSAYSTALSLIRVPDWAGARHCIALKQLAVVEEAMTAGLVEFRFPDGTRFPCLPVRASNKRGLVYPLEGSSWCTGPELAVAIGMGAIIDVKDGYRVEWIAGSIRLFEDITRLVGEIRAEAKALDPPDLVLDKTVKEIGNSVYGKIAQSVAGMRVIKDDVERRSVFNTMFGESDQLGPSGITNAFMATYCTGLVRALLLEAISRLPQGTWVGTATTDGFLSSCGLEGIDQSGPVAMAFAAARERITPGDRTIWETKHLIPRALVTKTRGTFTVAPADWNGASVVLAKAGYMTPEAALALSEIEQCRVWIELYRERQFATKMQSKSLTSLRTQHLFEVDLQSVVRDVRWNADFDLKRKLARVRDVDGLITAETVPWRSIDEFEQARDLLEDWKRSQRRVLKTKQDYEDMLAWGAAKGNRSKTGTRAHNKLAPIAAAVLKVLAHRNSGISEWFKLESYAQKAQLMSAICGVKITEMDVKNAKRRGTGPAELAGSIATLTDDDRRFLMSWFGFYSIAPEVCDIAEMLCARGSAATEELDELFDDAANAARDAVADESLNLCIPQNDDEILEQTTLGH